MRFTFFALIERSAIRETQCIFKYLAAPLPLSLALLLSVTDARALVTSPKQQQKYYIHFVLTESMVVAFYFVQFFFSELFFAISPSN